MAGARDAVEKARFNGYNRHVEVTNMTIAITKAKAMFSRYVALARRGEEIIISDRGIPVAKLAPLGTSDVSLTPHQLDMVRDGRLKLPKKKWDKNFLRHPPVDLGDGALRALIDEREEERGGGFR
jgi:prevent-host-death family protein